MPFTAADVKFTFERVANDDTLTQWENFRQIREVEIVNDHEILAITTDSAATAAAFSPSGAAIPSAAGTCCRKMMTTEQVIEADRDVPGQFDVLHLVFPDRHQLGVIGQDVGSHQHRVVEQAGADAVTVLAEAVIDTVGPLRDRANRLMEDEGALDDLLSQGAERARAITRPVLERVRAAMGVG